MPIGKGRGNVQHQHRILPLTPTIPSGKHTHHLDAFPSFSFRPRRAVAMSPDTHPLVIAPDVA